VSLSVTIFACTQNNTVDLTLPKKVVNWAPGRRVADALALREGEPLQLFLCGVILLKVSSYTDLPRKKGEPGTAVVPICVCKNILQVWTSELAELNTSCHFVVTETITSLELRICRAAAQCHAIQFQIGTQDII